MGSEFSTYLRLGLSHIADLRGYDHILFIVALTAGYGARDWRRLLWLVTAFTLGHSVTLGLATVGVFRVRSSLVEVLIAVTIAVAGAYGALAAGARDASRNRRQHVLYAMAVGFGFIHGLGFSTFLRTVLGAEERIVLPLFAFNVGLELGQLLIVAAVLLAGALACDALGLARRRWVLGLSSLTALLGLRMVWERVT